MTTEEGSSPMSAFVIGGTGLMLFCLPLPRASLISCVVVEFLEFFVLWVEWQHCCCCCCWSFRVLFFVGSEADVLFDVLLF
jgi:hypothetical protein